MVSLASRMSLALVLASAPNQGSPLVDARTRAVEFDLVGAETLLNAAAQRGDASARTATLYIRGLIDAREASRQGGSPESLAPVRAAIEALESIANGRPCSPENARLVHQAAAAAAQSEREEMRLYLDTAIRMETLQRAAGMPGAPVIPAAEAAGDLWLQVHRYEEARRAYDEATERGGPSLRTLAGRARAARGLNDVPTACQAFRALLETWGARSGQPAEIAEARIYVSGLCEAGAR
jgi:hypothetical protein